MINSERPWETSTERQVIDVGDFSDRVRWDAFLGLAASTSCTSVCVNSVHTRHVNSIGLT
ncbi:hypothetical protein APA_2112 [Pseudanabaena sp. lw0831]|uniref:hypothetical protein n=1 Tax=Pseudanabaena sp. lw0831 TaxID=1357935 RepID=UPI001915366E|nr:hypothetical protein [Pseudanabaena sp. lw0831]GBO54164.1 hypothetical protein APA_2112 [Pseudanabaena sp. lw0831]